MATPIPENSTTFSLADLASSTGARITGSADGSVQGVTSDSRRVKAGNLFVALRGEQFDGHSFIAQAAAQGARAVLVDQPVTAPAEVAVCRVDSTLDALGLLARAHRRASRCTVIGVAGSAGKTTTKTVVAAALEAVAPGAVHSTPGNLNNAIGVPFVLLALESQHRYAVVEIGTNQLGEVEQLSRWVEPDLGILTLVGLEHTEGLGDIDSIEQEESALLKQVPDSGTVVFNADDPRVFRQGLAARAARKLSYGRSQAATYRLIGRQAASLGSSEITVARPDGSEVTFKAALIGESGALAALAALATAEACHGAPLDVRAVERCLTGSSVLAQGRLCLVELTDGTLLVDDSYNSNPASVRSSLQTAQELARARGGRLLLVLGEMRELGEFAEREHRRLGQDVAKSTASYVVAIAGYARQLLEPVRSAGISADFADDSQQALALLLGQVKANDVVLVKASRGVRAEAVVSGLIDAKGRAA